MKLEFQYDLKKDVENYKIASQSENNRNASKMQALYMAEYGEVFEDEKLAVFTAKYIADQKLDIPEEIKRIEAEWQPIAQEYFKRVERIFGLEIPLDIVRAYLTTDTRCSYNIKKGYFFISISRSSSRSSSNLTVMHELFHFWTWFAFREEVESGRMTKECYNDVKESLTEILNLEFQDLLGEAHDGGYPQHQEMRAVVRKTWMETKDIKKVFEATSKMCPIEKTNSVS